MTTTATDTELSDAQIKAYAIQGQLGVNTAQRNGALADLNSAKYRLQQTTNDKHSQYFVLMGRLVKYEPDQVFPEVLQYALENGIFYRTESKLLGVMSKIGNYTTANGKKTFKAHFTTYGHFLRKCEKENEEPISYSGNFLMKNYSEYFVVDKTLSEYSKLEHFIKVKPLPTEELKMCGTCNLPVSENNYSVITGMVKEQTKIICNDCANPKEPEPEPEPEPEKPSCENCKTVITTENNGDSQQKENGTWVKYCYDCYYGKPVGKKHQMPKPKPELGVAPPVNWETEKTYDQVAEEIKNLYGKKTKQELYEICFQKGEKVNKSCKKEDLLRALIVSAFIRKPKV
jgi:hypothetical protein